MPITPTRYTTVEVIKVAIAVPNIAYMSIVPKFLKNRTLVFIAM